MKKFLYLVLLNIPILATAGNGLADSIFTKANRLYQDGRYEEASMLYLGIDSIGLQSAEVYFNAANAFFRSNKLGKARVYYEKALLLDPSDRDIRANLTYLESMLADRFEEVPEFFLRTWIRSFFTLWHSNTWAVISLISFTLFLAGGFLYIFTRKPVIRKTGFYASIFFIFLSIVAFGVSKYNYRMTSEPGTAVIMEGSQVVRSSPRTSGKELFILHLGTKVWLENELDGWYEIRITDGRKGWIPEATLEKI